MFDTSAKRSDPELPLRQVQAEEEYHRRGRLKIFLGYMVEAGGVEPPDHVEGS